MCGRYRLTASQLRCLGGLAVLLSLAVPANASIIIDNFTAPPDPGQSVTANNGHQSVSNSMSGLSGVLGGTRVLSATITGPLVNGHPTGSIQTSANLSGDNSAVFTESGRSQGTGTFAYTNLGGVNLLAGGNAGLEFKDWGVTLAQVGVKMTITIVTSTGTETYTETLAAQSTPIDKLVLFSQFSGSGNLGDVLSISVKFDGSGTGGGGAQVFYDTFLAAQLPEPTSMALLGMGSLTLLGVSFGKRRSSTR